VLITYRDFGSSTWTTINTTNIATYLRAFKDKNNNIHILAINSSIFRSLGLANYLFVNTSTNFVNVEDLNTRYLAYGITGFGDFGDIKVDNDLNVYIAINTKRGLTNGNDLLIKRNNTWQAPIRLPNNTSPINYFLNSIRLDIGKF
jgi:hypothetical protein